MGHQFFDLMFTPLVPAEQARRGSREAYAAIANDNASPDVFSRQEIDFVSARDSFYLASVSETGWPYVQHRGGPPGFLRCVGDQSLGWAEFVGNRQYVTMGNTAADDRVAMILLDYPHRRRLKILGHLSTHDAAERPDLALQLAVEGYRARLERLVLVTVAAFDWNCPQHITPRYTLAEVERLMTHRHTSGTNLEARPKAETSCPEI